jgi:hypothetical protein
MVLAADGWTLTGASTVSDAATSGLRWNLSYEHAGGDEGRSAALALFDRDKARGLATQLDPGSTDATVDGQAVSLAEERSPQDNHLVAIHAMWDTKDGVGWLTVYGSTRDDALHLVRDIELVSEQEWRAATAAVSEADRQQR